MNRKINQLTSLIFNIRTDSYKNKYQSSSTTVEYGSYNTSNNEIAKQNKNETIFSGRIALKFKKTYFTISRGHKAGGFNQNPYISESNRLYQPEYSNNFEFGYKNTIGPLDIDLNLFYMHRENLHVNIADQANPNNPLSFYFFTSNIKSGVNKGIDLNTNFKLNKNNNLFINLGILDTQRAQFTY